MSEDKKSPAADRWSLWRFFLGRCTGTGAGTVGHSQVERTYRLVLDDQFIRIESRSEFKPQERSPDGETHEEIGFLSCDRSRETIELAGPGKDWSCRITSELTRAAP